jgi:hypothetical protein
MYFVPKVPKVEFVIDTDKLNIMHVKPGKIYPKDQAEALGLIPPVYSLGRCRRHAPTMSGWPAVFVNDWCGSHKLDENKICEPNKE